MKILNFVKALLPRLEKDNILEDLRITISELDNVVYPAYQSAFEHFKSSKFKSDANQTLSTTFYRSFNNNKVVRQSNMVGEIFKRLQFIKENALYTAGQIEELFERDIISDGLTAKKAILIRSSEMISFISRYSSDFLCYLYINEAVHFNAEVEENLRLSKEKINFVEKNLSKFAAALSELGIPSKDYTKIVLEIPELNVGGKFSHAVAGVYKENDIDPMSGGFINGFVYNPIYHIRLTIAEWQAGRYKANKDKKKMLELRLLHLKLQQENKNDPKLEQEIAYIQSRVDKIERYLNTVEEDLES